MAGERCYYSLIECKRRDHDPIVFGVALFGPDHDVLVRLADAPPSTLRDGARWMMAARALQARLRLANPHSKAEVEAFMGREPNEMRLGALRDTLALATPEDTLAALAHAHLAPGATRQTPAPFVAEIARFAGAFHETTSAQPGAYGYTTSIVNVPMTGGNTVDFVVPWDDADVELMELQPPESPNKSNRTYQLKTGIRADFQQEEDQP